MAMDGGKFSSEEFRKKLDAFESFVNQLTQRNGDVNLEERRKKLLESIKFNDFFAKLKQIFELDLDETYAKRLFKKICNNPDCLIEWSEVTVLLVNIWIRIIYRVFMLRTKMKVFGYALEENNLSFNGSKEEEETNAQNDFLDEIQIFLASLKFRFGDASGESSRRDIIQAIHYTPEIDAFITVALKGAVTIWSNRLKLQMCTFLKVSVVFTLSFKYISCSLIFMLSLQLSKGTKRWLAQWLLLYAQHQTSRHYGRTNSNHLGLSKQ